MDSSPAKSSYCDPLSVWKCRGYMDDLAGSTLTLRELLRYFRQLDKLKQRKYSEYHEVESVFSETEFSEVSVFQNDIAENDSGISVSTSDTPRKRSRVLSLREVLYCSRVNHCKSQFNLHYLVQSTLDLTAHDLTIFGFNGH